MVWRAVIIGGDAAGMSAATRIRAARPDADVVVLERSRFTSYSACGIPFVVGGQVRGGVEALIARDPDEHRRRGLDVRIRHSATAIDTGDGAVEVLDEHAGETYRLGYDELLIATGGEPVRPDLPGIDLPMVRGVQDLTDAEVLLALAGEGCRRIVIVGGGYIGLEMAEAYIERGCAATIVERGRQPFGVIDEDLGAKVAAALRGRGVEVRTETEVSGFEPGAVLTDDGPIGADLVVLGLGVRPRSELAKAAGIELGAQGRDPRRRPPAHERPARVGGGRLRRVAAPGVGRGRAHRPRHLRQPPRPCRRDQHGRRRRTVTWCAGHGDHEAVLARGRLDRAPARRRQQRRLRRGGGHDRHHDRGRLPAPRRRT